MIPLILKFDLSKGTLPLEKAKDDQIVTFSYFYFLELIQLPVVMIYFHRSYAVFQDEPNVQNIQGHLIIQW